MGGAWYPRQQRQPGIHGYHPQRRQWTGQSEADLAGEEPHGQDGRARGIDGRGGAALQSGRELYQWNGFGG